jgi:hypothetical protein
MRDFHPLEKYTLAVLERLSFIWIRCCCQYNNYNSTKVNWVGGGDLIHKITLPNELATPMRGKRLKRVVGANKFDNENQI